MRDALLTHCSAHVPDALHERTNGPTNAEHPTHPETESRLLSNARGFVYLIRWPDHGFVKVGFSSDGKRWRPFVRRGGRLLALASFPRRDHGFDASAAEYLLHIGLPTRLARAFSNRSEAVDFLGQKGAGWSECYVDDGSLSLPMFILAAEVIRSEDPNAYWQVREHWERPVSYCPLHRGQLAHNCSLCRSERIAAKEAS